MLRLKPSHFQNPANFLFTASDGKVLSSGKIAQALKSAATRSGKNSAIISLIFSRTVTGFALAI